MAVMSLVTGGLTIPPAGAINAAASVQRLAAAGAQSLIPVTYGRHRESALVLNILPKAGDANTMLVQCLWGHALEAVETVRLNDEALPTGSTVTTYTGSQTAVDPVLEDAFAAQGITYTDALTGFAYSVVALPTRSFEGQLNISALLRGRKVYDPRLDSTAGGSGSHRLAFPNTWEYSDNPSLCLADWLASTVYGAGEPVDWASVPDAADANDETIGSPAEKRRLIGVTLNKDGVSVAAVGEALRAYSGVWMVPSGAGMRLLPDQDSPAVASYAHDDGSIAALEDLSLKDLGNVPTAVEVLYTDTSQIPWREASAVASVPGAGTTLPWRVSTVRMPGVLRYSQAMREATERLNKLNLGDLSFALEVFDIGIRHDLSDIVEVSHPVGLVDKPMRVVDVELAGPGRWRLMLTEHDPLSYSDEVETVPSIPDTPRNLPPGAATNVTALQGVAGNGRITWSWTPCPDADYEATELRSADSNWGATSPLPIFRGKASECQQLIFEPGDYTVYARHFGRSGNQSAVTASETVTATSAELGIPTVVVEFRDDEGVTYTNVEP